MAIINKAGITNGGTIQAEHITRVIDALSGVSTDTLILSGSMTGSLIGALTGTASFATSASRAVSSSFAATASYAIGSGTEYMTLRLTAARKNTTTTTFWVGANGSTDVVDRTGVIIPFNCIIVSASVYSNVQTLAALDVLIAPTLYRNTTQSPTATVAFDPIDLKNNYISGQSLPVNVTSSAGRWINLEVIEDATENCSYIITCDVLIKKT